jgi:thiol-disulfide isomerase/thioredoxin
MLLKIKIRKLICIFCMLSMWLAILTNAPAADLKLPKGIIAVENRPAPALVLKDIDGNVFDLADHLAKHKGQWVFVHFWASWCGPCRREMPAIQRMAEKLGDTPVKLAIINTAETEDTVFEFMGILAPDLVLIMDADGLATEAWQPRGLPSTYLVDPNGIIRYQAIGGRPWDEAEYMRFLNLLGVEK